MSYELIALCMFGAMVVLMLSGQRVFAVVGAVAATAALIIAGWHGDSLQFALETPFNAVFKLFNWHAMLTLPMFVYMGYILSESGIAEDLYRMMHVWFGRFAGGLAIGTILLMVIISCINGLSVAGIAIGSATLSDRLGPIGSSIVTALANARRQVDVAQTRALGSSPA